MSTAGPNEDRSVDTTINVAQLLKQPVGATRRYQLEVDELALGEDRVARHLHGPIKLTRVGRGLLLAGTVTGEVELSCVRCLDDYVAPVTLELEDEFRPSIDVTSGSALNYGETTGATEADYFLIDENHHLDLSEVLRQAAWVALPMMPICREDCPGVGQPAAEPAGEARMAEDEAPGGDARFAVLQRLLDNQAGTGEDKRSR